VPKKSTPTTTPVTTPEISASVIAPNTKLTLVIPWTQIEPAYTQALKKLAKQVRSSGFRPGKVPTHLAVDMIGQVRVKEEALKGLLTPVYQAAIEKSGKIPLTQPEFSAQKVELGADWEIIAEIAEKPVVSIKNYQKIAKDAKSKAEKEPAHAHGTPDEKTTAKKEETKELTTEEKKKQLEQEKAAHEDHLLQHILQALVLELKPAIPELLIKTETRAELEQLVRSLEQFGLKFDDYIARRQITFEQLSNELATQALSRLQIEFILEAITQDLKLVAEESEFEEYLNRISDEKARAQQKADPQYMAYLQGLVLRQKAARALLAL